MPRDKREQREHKRFGVKGCTMQYKSGRLFGLFSTISKRYLVLNISPTGLHFISKEELKPGQRILININAPLLDDEPIRAAGRVIWTKESTQHQAYRVGVTFRRLSHTARTRLKLILDNALLDKIDISTRMYLKEVEKL